MSTKSGNGENMSETQGRKGRLAIIAVTSFTVVSGVIWLVQFIKLLTNEDTQPDFVSGDAD